MSISTIRNSYVIHSKGELGEEIVTLPTNPELEKLGAIMIAGTNNETFQDPIPEQLESASTSEQVAS